MLSMQEFAFPQDLVKEHLFVKSINKDYIDRVLHDKLYLTLFESPHKEEDIDQNGQSEVVGDEVNEDM